MALGLVGLFFTLAQLNFHTIPSRAQLVVEKLLAFITNLVKENMGLRAVNSILYLVWFTFILILSLNLLGMIPYSFTVTSHFVITLTLSLSFFIGLNIVGFIKHGHHMLKLFLPEGAPGPLLPVLFVIEFISYISRIFSLAIRLFANLMSGHTLLKILAGFCWLIFLGFGLQGFTSVVLFGVIFLVTGLEIAIAALQAYVFCMLLCLYYKDAVYLH
jgi:ATP synthase subunit 6